MPIATHPDAGEVDTLGQPVPAEDPQSDERRLEEEGEQPLDRQRRAEDVADEPRILTPVHPELELQDDARHDADREVDQEELAPKNFTILRYFDLPVRYHAVCMIARYRARLIDTRHEEEVVQRRQSELPDGRTTIRPSGSPAMLG